MFIVSPGKQDPGKDREKIHSDVLFKVGKFGWGDFMRYQGLYNVPEKNV